MAADKSKLETYLNSLPLLKDEKLMWYRLGFYISSVSTGRDNRTFSAESTWVDAAGNEREISSTFSNNIRKTCIEWWQAEKAKPRAEELGKKVERTPFDTLDELESSRG